MKYILIILFPLSLQAQKKDSTYFIVGSMADFQLLYKAIADPDNVTRKQISDLAQWIGRAQMVRKDTAAIKPKK